MKLYHIPNLVINVKLKNRTVETLVCHLSFRYWLEDKDGSISINNEPLHEYLNSMIHGCILIEKEDASFNLFEQLSDKNELKCVAYSYSDIDIEENEVEIDIVMNQLEKILEGNLTELLNEQGITISEVSINY